MPRCSHFTRNANRKPLPPSSLRKCRPFALEGPAHRGNGAQRRAPPTASFPGPAHGQRRAAPSPFPTPHPPRPVQGQRRAAPNPHPPFLSLHPRPRARDARRPRRDSFARFPQLLGFAEQRGPRAKEPSGAFPWEPKARSTYICVGADTPMSERHRAITERTASQAPRRARTTAGSTGRPSLGSTWQAA